MGRFDIFRLIKRKRKHTKEFQACPICLSLNIKPHKDSYSGWLAPQQYICQDCGYFGPGYIVLDEEELIKHVEEQKKEKEKSVQNES
jgi:hypothetical protein